LEQSDQYLFTPEEYMKYKEIGRHSFPFNKQDNGGEQLILTTIAYQYEDGTVFTNQEISLQSYGNSASINLFSAGLDSQILRLLANELDEFYEEKGVG